MPLQKYRLKNQLLSALRRLRIAVIQLPQRVLSTDAYYLEVENQYWQFRALNIAAKKNIAEELDNGVLPIEMIAQLTQSNEERLYRLMRFLASFGVFMEYSDRRFAHTERSRRLSSNHSQSLKPRIILQNSEPMIAPLTNTPEKCVENQRPPFERYHHTDFFTYLSENRCFNYTFLKAKTPPIATQDNDFTHDLNWSSFKRIYDIGGNNSARNIAILEQYDSLDITVINRSNAIENTRKQWREKGTQASTLDRLHIIEADPLASTLPQARSQYDLYLLADIVHMLSDIQLITLLRSINTASEPFVCSIIIIDTLLPEKHENKYLLAVDFQTMLTTQGRQRTRSEWTSIAELAGLKIREVIKTRTQVSAIALNV